MAVLAGFDLGDVGQEYCFSVVSYVKGSDLEGYVWRVAMTWRVNLTDC